MFASYFSKNQMFSQFQHLWLFVEIFMDRYSFFFGYFGLFAEAVFIWVWWGSKCNFTSLGCGLLRSIVRYFLRSFVINNLVVVLTIQCSATHTQQTRNTHQPAYTWRQNSHLCSCVTVMNSILAYISLHQMSSDSQYRPRQLWPKLS